MYRSLVRALSSIAPALLSVTACFNPTGQPDVVTSEVASTDPSSSGPTTSEGSMSTGGSTTTSPTTETETETLGVTSTEGASTGGPKGCAEAPDPGAFCLARGESTPFCDLEGDECVECLQKDDCGSTGVCDETTKACVECVEDSDCSLDTAPACDPEAKTCGCSEHEQCPDTACQIEAGVCFPPAMTAVVYSRARVDCPPIPACNFMDPCCSMVQALERGLESNKSHIVIRVLSGPTPENPLIINPNAADRKIAVLGEEITPTIEPAGGSAPLIYVNQAPVRLYVAGLRMTSATAGAGISCIGGTGLWIDDTVIEDLSNGIALYLDNCPTSARRVTILRPRGGIHARAKTPARLVNTIIASPKDFAVKAESAGTIDLVYSTIVEQTGVDGRLLQCFNDMSKIQARNSVLFSVPEPDVSACSDVTVTDSAVTATALATGSVVQVSPDDVPPMFVDWFTDDLHVKNTARTLAGLAVRQAGDPPTDIDRQARPAIGANDWAGADVPMP